MTITALSGPVVQFGITTTSSGGGLTGLDTEHNSQRAPMVADLGDSMMDPRVSYNYDPGSGVTAKTFAFYNNVGVVDYVPTTLNASAFVSATVVATGVTGAFPLNAASSAGGTYSTTIIAPETYTATGTLLAIDSTAAYLPMGSDGTVALWNPGAGTGRNITIKLSTTGDAGTYSVAGRDMYGFKMTETITAGGATTLAGKKAFKYISSITNCTTPVSTGISIGFGDVYGLPFYSPYAGLNTLIALSSAASVSATIVPSTANFNAALASTATATSTTADVRGTFASTTASNGTTRLQIVVTPAASAIAAITSTNVAPLFGATQFSSV